MIPLPAIGGPKKLGAVAVLAVAAATGWMARGQVEGAKLAAAELRHARYVAQVERQAREQVEAARQREAAIVTKAEEVTRDAQETIDRYARDAAAAAAVRGGMLDAARTVAARCGNAHAPAAPAGAGSSAGMPGGMRDGDRLLRVLAELDGAAGAYAEHADRARAAAHACGAFYDEVRRAAAPGGQ